MHLLLLDPAETIFERKRRALVYTAAFCLTAMFAGGRYLGTVGADGEAGRNSILWLAAMCLGATALFLSRSARPSPKPVIKPVAKITLPKPRPEEEFSEWVDRRSRSFTKFDLSFPGDDQRKIGEADEAPRTPRAKKAEPRDPDPFARALEDFSSNSSDRRRI